METYYAFLLRLWQAGTAKHPAWRASLEDPHTRQVVHFSSLDALCAFLHHPDFSSHSSFQTAESQPQPKESLDEP